MSPQRQQRILKFDSLDSASGWDSISLNWLIRLVLIRASPDDKSRIVFGWDGRCCKTIAESLDALPDSAIEERIDSLFIIIQCPLQ